MKSFILLLIVTSVFAWDCSDYKATVNPDQGCRDISALKTMVAVDKLHKNTGKLISERSDVIIDTAIETIIVESRQCYNTCIRTNTKRQ